MNTSGKIQIESSLSALAKAHQELLAHFERSTNKSNAGSSTAVPEQAETPERAVPARRPRSK